MWLPTFPGLLMVHVMHTVSIIVKKVSFKIPYLKFHEASQPLYLVYMDSGLTHHVQSPHFPQDTFDTDSSTQTVLSIKNMLFTVTLYWSTAQKINPKQLKKHSWSTTFMEKFVMLINTLRNDLQRIRVWDWSSVEFAVLWSLLIGSIIENQFWFNILQQKAQVNMQVLYDI